MTAVRASLGLVGAAVLGWGLWLMLGLGVDRLVGTVTWLVGGVVVHDALLAPAVTVLGYLVVRRLPPRVGRHAIWIAVMLGTLTLAVLPSLGRFGAKPDDPYLLNRAYAVWWVALAVLLVGVAAAWELVVVPRRRDRATLPAEH